MLEDLGQVAVIVAAIGGGFSWMISFLSKKFQSVNDNIAKINQKLQERVTEKICQQRRSHLPCYSVGGGFKCPDSHLTDVLERIDSRLQKMEQRD